MKHNKLIYITGTLFLLTSCEIKVDNKEYDSYSLEYKEYANVEGHRYKYLKKDSSKELGEKVFKIYQDIAQSNEKYQNQYGAIGFEQVGYYSFNFNYGEKKDYFLVSKDDDYVFVYYKSSNRVHYRGYKSLSEEHLKEVKELKSAFEKMLSDTTLIYD